jgi:hypothetical protein
MNCSSGINICLAELSSCDEVNAISMSSSTIQLSIWIRYYMLKWQGLSHHLSRKYDLSNLDETIMSADVTISLTISAAFCPLFSSLSP